jgi:hypothetical protein
MDPQKALENIDIAIGQLTLNRSDHVQLQQCVMIVRGALVEAAKPKPEEVPDNVRPISNGEPEDETA